MQNIDFSVFIDNVRKLMAEHKITQEKLGEIAMMSQSNVSKALNKNNSQQFTLEQALRISDFFKVSVNELFGESLSKSASDDPKDVIASIIRLLCKKDASIAEVDIPERVHIFDGETRDYVMTEQIMKYPAVYFPSFTRHYVSDIHLKPSVSVDDAPPTGNQSRFLIMNTILKNIKPVVALYRNGSIDDDGLRTFIDGFNKEIDEYLRNIDEARQKITIGNE